MVPAYRRSVLRRVTRQGPPSVPLRTGRGAAADSQNIAGTGAGPGRVPARSHPVRPADQHQDRIGLADLPGLPQDLGLGDDEANPWLEHSPEPDPPGQPVVESPDWLEDLAPDAGVPETPQDEVFWATVTSLRKQVAEALSKRLKSEALTHDQQRAVGRRLIDDAVTDLVDASISAGDSARWTS